MDPLASINVDQGAKATPPWRFDEQVARIFEEHVRASVPFYDEIHRMIAELSDWFLDDSSLVYDLGTSTGEGILKLFERHGNESNTTNLPFEVSGFWKPSIDISGILMRLVSDSTEPISFEQVNPFHNRVYALPGCL